jgi:thiosulfate sulfurtransferase
VSYKRINCKEAFEIIQLGGAVVDVRDESSFKSGHIEGATHIDNSSLAAFIEEADLAVPLVVYCYHGNMSQGAAAYFMEQGFEQASSLDGGYDAWMVFSKA